MKIHIVKKGDTLYLLAQKYGVELDKLIAANPIIHDPDDLVVGLKVKIPTKPAQVILTEEGSNKMPETHDGHGKGWPYEPIPGHPTKLENTSQPQLEFDQQSDNLLYQQTTPAEKVSSFYDLPDLADMKQPKWEEPLQVSHQAEMPMVGQYNGPIYPGPSYVPYPPSEYPGLYTPSPYSTYPESNAYYNFPQNPTMEYGAMPNVEWEYPEKSDTRADDVADLIKDTEQTRQLQSPKQAAKKVQGKAIVKHQVKKTSSRAHKQPVMTKKSSPLIKY